MPLDPTPDLTRRPRTRKVFSEADMIRLRDLYYDRATPLTLTGRGWPISHRVRSRMCTPISMHGPPPLLLL